MVDVLEGIGVSPGVSNRDILVLLRPPVFEKSDAFGILDAMLDGVVTECIGRTVLKHQ